MLNLFLPPGFAGIVFVGAKPNEVRNTASTSRRGTPGHDARATMPINQRGNVNDVDVMSAGWLDVSQHCMHETRWRTESTRHQESLMLHARLEDLTAHLLGTQATTHSICTPHSWKPSLILFPALLAVAGSTSSGAPVH